MEYGTINGLKFVRARYQFTQAANSLKVHGLIYVHWEGPLLCEISMEDIEPGYEESEDICTASVLTFGRRSEGRSPVARPDRASLGGTP